MGIFVTIAAGSMLENLGSLQNAGFNSIGFEIDVEVPLLHFLGVGNHSVQFLDALNSLGGFLEKTLSDVGHDSFVLSDSGRDADQSAEFGREVDILSFLSDLEQRLVDVMNFDSIRRLEVVNHVGSSLLVAMVEDVVLGVDVPLDLVHLVGPVRPVLRHHDRPFELTVHEIGVVSLTTVVD
jgi:hypothetical protein